MRSGSERARFALLALGMIAVAGCSDGNDYRISLLFEPTALANRIDRIQLALVSECPAEGAIGPAPVMPTSSIMLERGKGSTGLGDIDDGEYGLYARGVGACVGAAGCLQIVIAPDGERLFNVMLQEIPASQYDPSLQDNGGCGRQATCREDGSAVVCVCPDGFVFDGTTCTPTLGEQEDSYVSDWRWLSDVNGEGPVERNASNNGRRHGDGNPIRIRRTPYTKGLGTSAPSKVVLHLDARCSRFQAAVGIDDEVDGDGEAQAEILVDNERKYRSGTLSGTSTPEMVDVDLRGAYELALLVNDLGDPNGDHVDWADARVTCEVGWRGDALVSYLSDEWVFRVQNGLGPAERDESNGEARGGDGRSISLNGQSYERGMGVAAPSEIVAELGGHCRRFQTDIGIDDEITSAGSVAFQVWGDDDLLFDTDTMTSDSETQHVNVVLAGYNRLRLLVNDAGDGAVGDHADWAGARLLCASGWEGQKINTYISDWAFMLAQNEVGPVERNAANGEEAAGDGPPLVIDGEAYRRGLGVHAPSQVRVNLAGRCSKFFSFIGIDDSALPGKDSNGVVFRVTADTSEVFESDVMHPGDARQGVDVNISGRSSLLLEVDSLGDTTSDIADWAQAQLTCDLGTLGVD